MALDLAATTEGLGLNPYYRNAAAVANRSMRVQKPCESIAAGGGVKQVN